MLPTATASLALSAVLIDLLCTVAVQAGWDIEHAGAVEDLLGDYIRTLPGGDTVELPRLFLYQGQAFSRACPQSGIDSPAYCPGDHTVYLEITLGNAVAEKFGDFGALSIIAHEFGHAYLFENNAHPPGKDGELAADAFAGGFARYVEAKGLLEAGDLDEARATFEAVGDYEVYHNDHHGTPMERRQAFNDGYLKGFRLPGDRQETPRQAPEPSVTPPASQPSVPPSSNPAGAAAPPIPVLGLGLAGIMTVIMVATIVMMVNRAGEDEF
ncbi:neutral zinc metallopeptidase family protein [Synechococcus sp. MEDNS5]|uniref:neutral zinc metallopeptidase n=1 Tax=Synechococcus sp. MEDNS5 TaxID=1442554 RepID=UPI0016443345|nr:neutral zinc metallopeptidase [Synechococcus sp. MEDNS5]QNJ06527.1 neutral zinc metallopeptidase family protein [Synechococcus sp. MEDNS5]